MAIILGHRAYVARLVPTVVLFGAGLCLTNSRTHLLGAEFGRDWNGCFAFFAPGFLNAIRDGRTPPAANASAGSSGLPLPPMAVGQTSVSTACSKHAHRTTQSL